MSRWCNHRNRATQTSRALKGRKKPHYYKYLSSYSTIPRFSIAMYSS